MSLSRAFTTKRARKASDVDASISLPQRSLTTKKSFYGNVRAKQISAPIELISTTNMLSYNAPDIYPRSRSSSSSTNSDGRSSLETAPSSVGTPFISSENSSIESSPTSSSPQQNHLSCYFGQNVGSDDDAPKIPTRALSHTKKSAEIVARKRSISRMSSPKNSISRISRGALSTARSSTNMFSAGLEVTDHNPFGNELAQVSELAEEYSITQEVLPLPVVDEEEIELVSKGFFKFRAEDYMSELQGLFVSTFGDVPVPRVSAVWI